MDQPKLPQDARLALLVSAYSTPLAVILVGLGLALSQPRSPIKEIVIGLLVFSVAYNLAVVQLLKRGSGGSLLIRARLWLNLVVNTLLVYELGVYWTPIWLILALTPLATAIYSSRGDTALVSAVVAAILLAIQATRYPSGPLDWAQQLAQALFILLTSLMANELAALAKASRG